MQQRQPGREGQREENLTSSTTSLLKPHSAFGADLPTLGPSESLLKLMLLDKIEPRDVEEELTVSTSETNRKPETQSASTPQMPPPHSIILSSPMSETQHLLSIMYFRRSKCLAFTW